MHKKPNLQIIDSYRDNSAATFAVHDDLLMFSETYSGVDAYLKYPRKKFYISAKHNPIASMRHRFFTKGYPLGIHRNAVAAEEDSLVGYFEIINARATT